MANPQLSQGYTRVANEILEALSRFRMSGQDWQLLNCVFRQTYGFQRNEAVITTAAFRRFTGLTETAIHKARARLLKMRVVEVEQKGRMIDGLTYRFNKDYQNWIPLSKKTTLVKKDYPCQKRLQTLAEKSKGVWLKKDTPIIKETLKDTFKERYSRKEAISEIIKDLNTVCGTSYRVSTRKTQSLIKARLEEGFTVQDFKKVHRVKQVEWGQDPKMSTFLRPKTLYSSSNFEGYLNQKPTTSGKQGNAGTTQGRTANPAKGGKYARFN